MTEEKVTELSVQGWKESRFLSLYHFTIKPRDFFERYWRNKTLQSKLEKEYETYKLNEILKDA